ncbi:hypothetical protein DNH61_21355 [Paenibacillus sambharensis]|uniref:Branched-chain amino acid ABC transporter permease n=2 Tax=Paenibacillus sambharensis TaxID=1803190 RepID=A0A2W1L460_9BACL|nr:hypothetical protein DNH61_21355 [Paenibacillus sambharensis]
MVMAGHIPGAGTGGRAIRSRQPISPRDCSSRLRLFIRTPRCWWKPQPHCCMSCCSHSQRREAAVWLSFTAVLHHRRSCYISREERQPMTDYPRRLEQVKSGLVDSLPIVMGYIPACITFGLVGKTLSLGDLEVFLLSAVVYAGASQFIGAKLLAAGTAGPIILLLTLIINLRYFFISMSFRQKVNPKSSLWSRGLISFGLTEEVYAMGMLSKTNKERKEAHTLPYLLALELPPYLITLISTWVGIILAGYIPEAYLPALNTSLYALLIAIIVPQLLGNRRNTAICLSASASSWLLQGYLGNATVLAAMFIGAWVGMMMPPSSGRTISSPGSEQVRSDVE